MACHPLEQGKGPHEYQGQSRVLFYGVGPVVDSRGPNRDARALPVQPHQHCHRDYPVELHLALLLVLLSQGPTEPQPLNLAYPAHRYV